MPAAQLTWNPNQEPDLAGYKVYRGLGGSSLSLLATLGKVTTYTDSTIPDVSQSVTCDLTAFDLMGNESAHSAAVTKAIDITPPQAPTGLTVAIQ